uniref:Uncharacterized protein n=1 Tax=Candidatus Kentrum sp. LPFa TaxID=2126335 RepID=A0A450WTI7_9GAMM|nr:MAG: hypothetical protein BECKLPF1236B_GA0070989_12062 [Candidatus Kentron sp. LPFa]
MARIAMNVALFLPGWKENLRYQKLHHKFSPHLSGGIFLKRNYPEANWPLT